MVRFLQICDIRDTSRIRLNETQRTGGGGGGGPPFFWFVGLGGPQGLGFLTLFVFLIFTL